MCLYFTLVAAASAFKIYQYLKTENGRINDKDKIIFLCMKSCSLTMLRAECSVIAGVNLKNHLTNDFINLPCFV